MAGLGSVGRSFTRLFRRRETVFAETSAETPQGYLQITTKCMEKARKMSISTSLKFNCNQCKYLVQKLEMAVQNAYLLSESSTRSGSPEFFIFKFLFALAKEVETFIQSCCQDEWIQAAVFLTDVSKHVSSIAINLEAFTKSNAQSNAISKFEVDRINTRVVEDVETVASLDEKELLIKVKSFVKASKSSDLTKQQLATFLLERLECSPGRSLSEPSPANSSERFFTNLEQMELLGRGATATVHRAMAGSPSSKENIHWTEQLRFQEGSFNTRTVVSSKHYMLTWLWDAEACMLYCHRGDGWRFVLSHSKKNGGQRR